MALTALAYVGASLAPYEPSPGVELAWLAMDIAIQAVSRGRTVAVCSDLAASAPEGAPGPLTAAAMFGTRFFRSNLNRILGYMAGRLASPMHVTYSGPFSTISGYANEAFNIALSLEGRVSIALEVSPAPLCSLYCRESYSRA